MDAQINEEDLLASLIYGVLHEEEPLTGAEFAVKIAVCARLTNGDQEEYGKAVRKAMSSDGRLIDIFPAPQVEVIIKDYLRTVRKARNNQLLLVWLGNQFPEPKSEAFMREYMIAVERVLSANFMAGK